MPSEIAREGCPLPVHGLGETILLAHGEGGRLLRRLLAERVLPALGLDGAAAPDAAHLPLSSTRLAFTTDSFVVSPLFFPGGDIGRLAVFGTGNDLLVSGARPRWISLALIIEEGLELALLERVLASVAASAEVLGVRVVTGDIKVVPRGAADRLFINTAGIGEVLEDPPPGPAALEIGDEILVSGPIAQHGVAVMAAREELGLSPAPRSECASLGAAVDALRAAGIPVRAMRDATRGGVAAVLHEWAAACGHALSIVERRVPLADEIRGACELLGLDPLHVANEGTMVVAVESGAGDAALKALRSVAVSSGAASIGHVVPRQVSPVLVARGLGRPCPLDEPLGAPLPRIC
ncbi:MAG: hydrogenase expression/formation protein HypE [Planctomycetaceae bacterium]|nr:hydrogenase expression/formation protein HypE [Planctomycetaceae bacterium]